jgi:hypothetical protein
VPIIITFTFSARERGLDDLLSRGLLAPDRLGRLTFIITLRVKVSSPITEKLLMFFLFFCRFLFRLGESCLIFFR